MNIGLIDNLSASRFRLAPINTQWQLTQAPPAEILRLAEQQAFDAALIPSAGIPRLQTTMSALNGYGIATRGAVSSVILYSQQPLETLLADKQSIQASMDSVTSVSLLNILCLLEHGTAPQWSTTSADSSEKKAVAELFIGQAAMQQDNRWPYAYDLAEWWYRLTSLPFVFGIWVVKKDLPAEQRAALCQWLDNGLHRSKKDKQHQQLSKMHHPLPAKTLIQYYGNLYNQLAQSDMVGLKRFLKYHKTLSHNLGNAIESQ